MALAGSEVLGEHAGDAVDGGGQLAVAEEAAGEKENVMPYILEAVRCYASLGEICDILRRVFGVYKER